MANPGNSRSGSGGISPWTLVIIAAAVILVTAVERFVHPQPLENVGIGLLISVVASIVVPGAASAAAVRSGAMCGAS